MSADIEIQHASKFLDASVLRLTKLAGRYQIKASKGGGGKSGNRRHFSLQDICRLGMTVWLSNAGLRAAAIKDILSGEATGSLLRSLNRQKNVEAEAKRKRYLVAVGFRGSKNGGYRSVKLAKSAKRMQLMLAHESGASVPIGRLLDDLARRLESFASF